jgi:histidinol-phosphate aminotransferase
MEALSQQERQALHDALDDEYHAWATYDRVIADFGPVRPFTNIREAEARHIGALAVLFDRFGLALPENPWPGKVPRFATLRQACEAGVAGEIANAALYERLLAATQRPEILVVLHRLQQASQQRHLPAFQRCVERGGQPGAGRGCGRGSPVTGVAEKGGGGFEGIKLLLCENPLPPIAEAIAAAQAEVPRSNLYTEAWSAPLRQLIAGQLGVPEPLVHINAGSETILRQLFRHFGQQVHLLLPTYPLFPEIAERYTATRLVPEQDFAFDLARLEIPPGTTLAVIVNPNNPNGAVFDMSPLPELLRRHPETRFLVDEASIGMAGESVAPLVPRHSNLLVTRTLSKAHSLAGFRVGYGVLPQPVADALCRSNDAYPLSRASQAAAVATLRHPDAIRARVAQLRRWTEELAAGLRGLGVRTFPTQTYFFLTDFAPHDAAWVARELALHNILVRPLGDADLGPGFVRVTTATPQQNQRVVAALRDILHHGTDRAV